MLIIKECTKLYFISAISLISSVNRVKNSAGKSAVYYLRCLCYFQQVSSCFNQHSAYMVYAKHTYKTKSLTPFTTHNGVPNSAIYVMHNLAAGCLGLLMLHRPSCTLFCVGLQ